MAEESITFAVGEYPPYVSEKQNYEGIASHIVKEAFALEGITVTYKYFPWGRSYEMARQGDVEGTMPWFKSAEREKDFFYSDQVMSQKQVFFHLKTYSFDWENIDDLIGIEIGGTQTYFYGQAFEDAEKSELISVERVPDDLLNFKKILGGRIQIFPLTIDIGFSKLREHFKPAEIKLITFHSKPLQDSATYALFSKKTPKRSKRLLKLLNQGLNRLKESGEFELFVDNFNRGDYSLKKAGESYPVKLK